MSTYKTYFDLSEIKTLMIQLLKAVDYLHRNFIIHRDLKLSNILLNKYAELKLADFGLARYFGILPIKNRCAIKKVYTESCYNLVQSTRNSIRM